MQVFQIPFVVIAVICLIPGGLHSFVFHHSSWTKRRPSSSSSSFTGTAPSTTTKLWLAGRRSTGNKKNTPNSKKKKKKTISSNYVTKNKKTKPKSNNNNKGKGSGAVENPMATTKATNPKKTGGSKKVAPPWQTISTKDIKQNVEAEKERRKIAQETGRHMTALELEESKVSYQRSKSFLSPEDQALLAWKPFSLNPNKHEVLFQGAFLNKQMPPRLGTPEVAFLGRSNVGKSSLLNRLVGKSDLARVGKTPGATASVNQYGIFDRTKKQKALMGLIDLPGFGYAKLDKETKQSVQDTAENYLAKRKELALGVLLVDSRRTPTMDDKTVLAALYDMGLPLMVVATKVDKYSTQKQVDEALGVINRELGLPKGQPLCISSMTGDGIRDLWKIIMEACEGHVGELKTEAESGSPTEQQKLAENAEYYDDGDDDGEIAYSQGYDWIQGAVMYEEEEGDYDYYDEGDDDMEDFDGDYDEYDDEYDDDDYDMPEAPQRETLKSLRKKAKDMEKRGEL